DISDRRIATGRASTPALSAPPGRERRGAGPNLPPGARPAPPRPVLGWLGGGEAQPAPREPFSNTRRCNRYIWVFFWCPWAERRSTIKSAAEAPALAAPPRVQPKYARICCSRSSLLRSVRGGRLLRQVHRLVRVGVEERDQIGPLLAARNTGEAHVGAGHHA